MGGRWRIATRFRLSLYPSRGAASSESSRKMSRSIETNEGEESLGININFDIGASEGPSEDCPVDLEGTGRKKHWHGTNVRRLISVSGYI